MSLIEISRMATDLWSLWLMVLFLGIVVWTFWPSSRRREEMHDHAMIPFREDEESNGNSSIQ